MNKEELDFDSNTNWSRLSDEYDENGEYIQEDELDEVNTYYCEKWNKLKQNILNNIGMEDDN